MAKWPEKTQWHDGVRMQFDYDDYILSVVRFTGSYGYRKGLWEIAFMDRETQDFVEPPLDFMNEYSFSGDVGIYGHLNDPEVDRIVQAMEKLDNAN
tara:strand:+ start:4957 stop:5244 length:288 start_codon:yes stop_codon:yes gene_type:complete